MSAIIAVKHASLAMGGLLATLQHSAPYLEDAAVPPAPALAVRMLICLQSCLSELSRLLLAAAHVCHVWHCKLLRDG